MTTPSPTAGLTEVITYGISPIVVTWRRPAGASPFSGPPVDSKQAVGSLLPSPSPRRKGTYHVLGQVPPSDTAKPAGNWRIEAGEAARRAPNKPGPKAKAGERSQTNPTELTILESIRCAQNLENKPNEAILRCFNGLEAFWSRNLENMDGTLLPYCGFGAAASMLAAAQARQGLPPKPRCSLESTDTKMIACLLRIWEWSARALETGAADFLTWMRAS